MKRIAIIILGLLLSTCGAESPTSPQAVAGIYTLQAVKIDSGRGRALVYLNREAEKNPPTGFIELNPDRTYRLFASFGSPEQSVWETNGNYAVNSKLEITFSTSGRNFSGFFYDKQSRIAVTESLSGSIVLLVFERDLGTLS